jgi:hypothetical protein
VDKEQAIQRGKHRQPPHKVGAYKRKIDVGLALKLRLHNGLSYDQIGTYFGATKQAVSRALAKFTNLLAEDVDLKGYEQCRADLLTAAEMTLLNEVIDPAKLQKASVNNLAFALGKVFDMNRITQGKSTSIVVYGDLQKQHEELIGEIAEMEKALEAQLLTHDQHADTQSAGR